MTPLPSQDDIAAAVPPADLRALLILQTALATGPLLFAAVTLVMPIQPQAGGPGFPPAFSIAHALVTVSGWAGALLVPRGILRQAGQELRTHPPLDARVGAAAFVARYRAARIFTLALLEGAALMGVGLVFLARTGGVLGERPELYAHLLPLLVLLAFAAGSLPSAEAIGRAWREHVIEGTDAA